MTDSLKNVLEKINACIRSGAPHEGVEIAQAALRQWPAEVELTAKLGLALEAMGRRKDAIKTLEEANKQISESNTPVMTIAQIKFHLVLCHVSEQNFERAAELSEEVIQLGVRGASIFSTACKARFKLGEVDAAVRWGAEALKMLDDEAKSMPSAFSAVPRERVKEFNPHNPEKNIISYSLFGQDSYYHDCAITNARIAMASFPDFSVRVYCGPDVPPAVKSELQQHRVDVRNVERTTAKWEGLFWRFWAFDDENVDVVLVRDVDSPLTPRERIAVEDWLYNSTAPFHVIRDHPLHTAPIMAGLWGGFTGLLPPLKPLGVELLNQISTRFADQAFLTRHIWPLIREASLTHDSYYDIANTRRFPPWGRVIRPVHVGWSWPTTVKSGRSIS